jgi:D-arabinose 1-dehydrogenase-like Zn-dependent alcohol dehydrogenase
MAAEGSYDAIVIGAGQGGKPLSMVLARAGLKTAVIEERYVGGTCVNYGCGGAAMSATLGGLAVNGKLVILGAAAEPLQVRGIPLILGKRSVMGWPSGTSIHSQDMLNFSLLTGVRSMSEVFPLERAAEAYAHMMSGKARFRVVLTTER